MTDKESNGSIYSRDIQLSYTNSSAYREIEVVNSPLLFLDTKFAQPEPLAKRK
jgi:hypothetical protein